VSTNAAIDHLALTWRPLAAGLGDTERFGRFGRALAGRPLDAAIDAATDREEVVCLRVIEVPPVRVTASVSDDELRGTLARAIAASVEAAVSGARVGDATLVRYHSRAHAALDVAVSCSRGDHRREWAWRQLGLWPASAEHLATALAEVPDTVPSLISAAAEAGALGTLADLLGPARLDGIVRAAWSARGCRLPGWQDMFAPGVPAPDDAELTQGIALLNRSALGRNLLSGTGLPPQSVAAASAAALLASEPALALRPAATVMRLLNASVVVSLGRSRSTGDIAESETGGARRHAPVGGGEIRPGAEIWPGAPAPAVAGPPAGGSPEYRGARTGGPGQPRGDVAAGSGTRAAAPGQPAGDVAAGSGTRAAAPGQPAGEVAGDLGADPPEPPQPGVATEFGGLPFLLHLIGRCGVPERVAQGELADAGLVRTLYEIGTRVLGRLLGARGAADPEDAALACLCGRSPFAGWHGDIGSVELSAHARQLADGEAERVIAALRAALEPSELAGAPEEELLTAVCRRRGRVVADPGWIDVHLQLAEVSTDVRRASLDTDLGYLPWLGCVVRFVYV
jgi:hypothetical protein